MKNRLFVISLFLSLFFGGGCGLSVPLAPLMLLAEQEQDRLPKESPVVDPYVRFLSPVPRQDSFFRLPEKGGHPEFKENFS
jgi:hypothetical protein